jgi:hypothetical protein
VTIASPEPIIAKFADNFTPSSCYATPIYGGYHGDSH